MNDLAVYADLDPSAQTLRAGELRAVFMPGRGMLGASLQHRGDELLGRVDELASFAQSGRTCGIPLLYPWANRLSGTRYRAAGREVDLQSAGSSIGHDGAGLPMHGVPWPHLAWRVTDAAAGSLTARLEWTSRERLAVFPFPHTVEMTVQLSETGLQVETALEATGDTAVPASFGFHPYVQLPGLARAEWEVDFPSMSHLLMDAHQVPTGETVPFPARVEKLGAREFDDGFQLLDQRAVFSIAGGDRKISVDFTDGFTYAQIYAPRDKNYIAIEPMTAPANALVSGQGLRLVRPGQTFHATFHIGVQSLF